MGKEKHIVIISPGFPESAEDYLCIPPLQAYLPALQARFPDWRISVIAVQYPYKAGTYSWKGFDIYALGGKNKRLLKPIVWRKAAKRFRQLQEVQPVDCIHSLWLQECTWLAAKMALPNRIPHIATIMGQDALPENRYIPRLRLEEIRVAAISKRAAEHYGLVVSRGADAIIPWGISAEEAGWKKQDKPRSIDILGVGSHINVKKYDRFIRVISALREKKPDLKAVLVGDGPERDRLEAMSKDLGLEKNLKFMGILPRPEVLKCMEMSKVFVHPALFEGQGYVFLEALSRGMHVLSGKVGMARETDKWKLCDHTIDFVEKSWAMLNAPVDEQPRILQTMDETVNAYARLYEAVK